MTKAVHAAPRSKGPLTRWAVDILPPRGVMRVSTLWVGAMRERDPGVDLQARRVVGERGHYAPRTRIHVIVSVTPSAQTRCLRDVVAHEPRPSRT